MSYLKRTFIILFIIGVLAIGLFLSGLNLYTDWLWFVNLQVQQVFTTILMTKIWVRIALGLFFALLIFVNLLFTKKKVLDFFKGFINRTTFHVVGEEQSESSSKWLTAGILTWFYLLVSILLGFLTTSINPDSWEVVLKYLNRTPFGNVDPIFGKDIGFYIFELPFFQFAYSLLTGVVILTGIIVALIYLVLNFQKGDNGYRLHISEKLHLSTLAAFFFIIKAGGYLLQKYGLLYSTRGVVFGASYTDVKVQILALNVMMVVVGLLAIFTLINIFTRKMKLIYIGIAVWLVVSIVLGGFYPGIIQKYRVEPNEIEMEKKYIEYNINHTLQAFGLEEIEQNSFDVTTNLTPSDMEKASDIIKNIRLWDWRPLQKTYSQLQEIRPYYDIEHVDIDRYVIDGVYRQVMLAPRELNQSALETRAQTWINQVLKYTHGMGLVMSPVNVITPQGLPELYIKNIPPVSNIDIEITQPRIYFGEKTNSYVIVNSKTGEMDYTGTVNYYDGVGGIEINNIWRRLMFAIKYNTTKILLSSDIRAESRLMFDRNIITRVKKIAPFLKYDKDPYMVINDGNLYWMIDAYTTTNMYPYSEPVRGWGNYVRNSAKVVVDAYHGTVDYYISDSNDPLIQTYAKIFPDIFKPLDEMPEGIKDHIRYPVDLFKLQTQVYATYHMEDPTIFFNKEDLWNIPKEQYAGDAIDVEPYYIITRLPGEENVEFVLIQSFTPARKNNMVSWLVVKSDSDEYGKFIRYNFPKDRTIYGPMMIEARIDQNSVISQQLTLWDQKGSSVIRGNLLIIPIKDSILYVEPIYLQSQQSQLPELKRVIVVYGNEVAMETTLQGALSKIFGIQEGTEERDPALEELSDVVSRGMLPLAEKAVTVYTEAQIQLKEGNFAGYGEKISELKSILQQIKALAEQDGETETETD
ncbi:MAG: UPF0182 family protein [Halanaerobiales bacterium]|nr:UPF0182 family protein [Halanaerobiales bacterium]